MNSTRRTLLAAALGAPAAISLGAVKAPRYRTLGRTGLKVSEVGFGSEAVSDISVYRRALDLGINFFDTARNYENGNAERMLGEALGPERKNVVFCSRSYSKDAKVFTADLDASLKQAGTDYFDIFFIGNCDKAEELTDELIGAQMAAQKAGKIRFRALSTHRFRQIGAAMERGRFDVVMVPYNFLSGTPMDRNKGVETAADVEQAIEKCHETGVGVVAMKVMAGGIAFNQRRNGPLKNYYEKNPGGHLSALKWALRRPCVHTTVPRCANMEMLEENVRAMHEPYSESDAKILVAASGGVRPYVCSMCGSCDGACPRGLPVSDLVRYAMYADGYGDFAKGQRGFRMLPAAVQQVRCADCRSCAVSCANGVHVRERLIRAQELFA